MSDGILAETARSHDISVCLRHSNMAKISISASLLLVSPDILRLRSTGCLDTLAACDDSSLVDALVMTLLTAAVDGGNIWMVADTAISGVGIEVRDRNYQLKIIPSRDGRALLGFAGDLHHGARLVEEAALLSAGKEAVAFLLESHCQNSSSDFAYGYMDEAGPHLVRVSQGEAQELATLHLGLTDAFNEFQRIRHDAEIRAIPEAVSIFFTGSRATNPVPPGLDSASTSMLRLFAERSERDVGGWPVAYQLTSEGAFLCGYMYSASDPILTRIGPGSLVPHGTAEAGGFGLSVTELGRGDGLVVYWRQLPGGTVFRKTADGYEVLKFDGTPSTFKERVFAATGQPVEIMFNDQPAGPLESITVMRDERGVPSMVLAKHGDAISFSVLNVGTTFRTRAMVNFKGGEEDKPGGMLATDRLSVALNDDKSTATIDLLSEGTPSTRIELQPSELDAALAVLGEARAIMHGQVAVEPPQERGTRELMVLNPAWRTSSELHPSLSGIILRLRHPGFGWLTFHLPPHEAHALGDWLTKNAPPQRTS